MMYRRLSKAYRCSTALSFLQDLPELSLACFPHGSELDHESSLLALPNGNKIGKAVEASSTSRFVVFEGQKLDTP